MTTRMKLFVTAAALVVIGVIVILLQPGPPEGECASADGPTSGFVDSTRNCPISIDSFEKIRDNETSPKLFRIAGLVIIVVGIGTAGAAGAAALRRRSRSPETSQG